MTNGDAVRQMSDDELEEWFFWMAQYIMRFTDSRVAFYEWLRLTIDQKAIEAWNRRKE